MWRELVAVEQPLDASNYSEAITKDDSWLLDPGDEGNDCPEFGSRDGLAASDRFEKEGVECAGGV